MNIKKTKAIGLILAALMCFSILPFGASASAGTKYEVESNNTMALADRTYDDYDNYGQFTSTSDSYDYWVVSFSQAGSANFWLGNIPAGCDFDLTLYNSSGTVLASSANGSNTAELITCNVSANTNYYMRVSRYTGTSSAYYLCRTKITPVACSHTWAYYADTAHPHQLYEKCTKCGTVVYLGVYAPQPNCATCTSGAVTKTSTNSKGVVLVTTDQSAIFYTTTLYVTQTETYKKNMVLGTSTIGFVSFCSKVTNYVGTVTPAATVDVEASPKTDYLNQSSGLIGSQQLNWIPVSQFVTNAGASGLAFTLNTVPYYAAGTANCGMDGSASYGSVTTKTILS